MHASAGGAVVHLAGGGGDPCGDEVNGVACVSGQHPVEAAGEEMRRIAVQGGATKGGPDFREVSRDGDTVDQHLRDDDGAGLVG